MKSRTARYALICLGWLCVGLGVVGIVVPGLPTTPFLLIAAWAFSKSSERFQAWLINHPRFGPYVKDWRERGAIPRKAKFLAVGMMTTSFLLTLLFVSTDWRLLTVMAVTMTGAGLYVCTRPDA